MSMFYQGSIPTYPRHKVFVSYHHSGDQDYRNRFEYMFAYVNDIMVVRSVQIGDLDPNLKTETIRQKIRDEYLRDSTVTVVLIGAETWKRNPRAAIHRSITDQKEDFSFLGKLLGRQETYSPISLKLTL